MSREIFSLPLAVNRALGRLHPAPPLTARVFGVAFALGTQSATTADGRRGWFFLTMALDTIQFPELRKLEVLANLVANHDPI